MKFPERKTAAWILGPLVLVSLLLTSSCNDDGVNAPSSGTLAVTANPGDIVINRVAVPPQDEGSTTVTALALDMSGFPLKGINIFFTSNAGQITPTAPPGQPPVAVLTDENGLASAILTVGFAGPGDIEVLASSGAVSGTTTVTKTLFFGDQPAEAVLTFDPATGPILEGESVRFIGSASSDPDGDPITCYQFKSVGSIGGLTTTLYAQGPTKSTVLATFNQEQDLDVELRVSSDPAAPSTFCTDCDDFDPFGTPCGQADESNFSPNLDFGTYQVVCDLSPPLANAGTNQGGELPPGGTVEVTLFGSGTDPDSASLTYSWACPGATVIVVDPLDPSNVTCTYDLADTYVATLTVTNDCGLEDTDNASIFISDPSP